MTTSVRLFAMTAAMAALTYPAGAVAQEKESGRVSNGHSCIAEAKGFYGFQCHGSVSNGAGGLEPATFVGTVEGDRNAVYEGHGQFNSGAGSVFTHFVGKASFGDKCFGHIQYDIEILSGAGSPIPLPPIAFDFITVDGGREILGTGAPVSRMAQGDAVPRLTCRLVKIPR